MITFIRSLFSSRLGAILALGFVVLMAISFGLSDVTGSGSFGGVGQGNAAQVGSQKIGIGELKDAVENRLRAERRQNPTLDTGRFVESGGLDATLDQLIDRYALSLFGEKYGIAVSDNSVNGEILKLPGVKGADGKFDQAAFAAFLQELKITDKMVRDDYRLSFYARQMIAPATAASKAPAKMALPYASLDLEKRAGEVGVIPATAFLPKAAPTDAVLTKYFRDNSTRYNVPERRAINYAMFDASSVDAKATPSEQEIADYYKANASKYAATQTRDFVQLVFPTQAAAKAAADKISGGKTIDAVAKEIGLNATRSSNITREALTRSASKAVADAVFATSQGGVSAPARGSLGYYVVSVSAIKNVPARTLAAAKSEIAAELKTQKRAELLDDLTTQIEDAFDNGESIADVAKAQGLRVETTPLLFANGQNPTNKDYRPIPEMQVILPAAFQLDTDGAAQLVQIEEGKRFAMVSVADFKEAAPPPLAEIRDIVTQQWALAEGNKAARAKAEEVRKTLANGQSMASAIAGIEGAKVENINSTRGELKQQGQQVSPPLALMFSMKKGTSKTIQAPRDLGWFVVQLNEVVRGDASGDTERLENNQAELTNQLSQEYAAQLINAAKKEVGVEKNESAIKALRDSLTGKNQQ